LKKSSLRLHNPHSIDHACKQEADGKTSKQPPAAMSQAICDDKLSSLVHLNFNGKKMNVLALGAHPDDLEIGCGGTLSRLRNEGHNILAITFTEGEKGLSRHTRRSGERVTETRKAMKTLGSIRTMCYSLPDTKLSDHIAKIIDIIEEIVEQFEPDLVFTHTSKDVHQDHRAVHEATIVAMQNKTCSILCYENCRTDSSFNPSFFVNLDGVVDKKITALKRHKTQNGKPYLTPDIILANAIFRGSQARLKLAEAFEINRMVVV
jgi:LmbE family N-acetylglucosaminyl deacetylase